MAVELGSTIEKFVKDIPNTTSDLTNDSGYITNSALSNTVTFTQNNNVGVAGTTKTTYKYGQTAIFAPNGLIMGGTAAAAGLVTRGICGVAVPNETTGACQKENLYINYDGDSTYRAGRQVVLQAGSVGNHLGNNLYQYAAARGDAVKAYGDAHYQAKGNYAANAVATQTTNGLMSATDKKKLDGLEGGSGSQPSYSYNSTTGVLTITL